MTRCLAVLHLVAVGFDLVGNLVAVAVVNEQQRTAFLRGQDVAEFRKGHRDQRAGFFAVENLLHAKIFADGESIGELRLRIIRSDFVGAGDVASGDGALPVTTRSAGRSAGVGSAASRRSHGAVSPILPNDCDLGQALSL